MSFKKLFTPSLKFFQGPEAFFRLVFKDYFPQGIILDAKTHPDYQSLFQPNLFNFHFDHQPYLIVKVEHLQEKELEELLLQQNPIFFHADSIDKRKKIFKNLSQNLILEEHSFENSKVFFAGSLLSIQKRKKPPKEVLQKLVQSLSSYSELQNLFSSIDIFLGDQDLTQESAQQFIRQSPLENDFLLCENILRANYPAAIKQILQSRTLNGLGVNSLLNKMAYSSYLKNHRPDLLPAWLRNRSIPSAKAKKIVRLTSDLEKKLKSSNIDPKDALLGLISSLEML